MEEERNQRCNEIALALEGNNNETTMERIHVISKSKNLAKDSSVA